ncbi:MAG: hypothetical protein ACREIA_24875 [Opitutaceae bacterium]
MKPFTRRDFVRGAALAAAASISRKGQAQPATTGAPTPAPAGGPPRLRWLEGKSAGDAIGSTWGVPWKRGAHRKGTAFALRTTDGAAVPVQTWETACWPDGSVKWTAHAIPASAEQSENFVLDAGQPAAPAHPVDAIEDDNAVTLANGIVRCVIPKSGDVLIATLARGDRETLANGRLVALRQGSPDAAEAAPVEPFTGRTEAVTIEQTGPVRATVKITGKHRGGADVMHTYDADRHVWRYDVGGYAWDNSELSPDLWLWYSFLRTGDAGVFRLAEAMTRHTRDVDIYHAGRFAGLGSRHNVLHWGCSAKQLRISTAAYRRFHYFLTADERTGDVLAEVTEADRQLAELNPVRKVSRERAQSEHTHIGVGTDWGSAAANWLTAWERTGDTRYGDWLRDAMRVIGGAEHGFFTGAFIFDPETKKLTVPANSRISLSHLSAVFGLVEICAELIQLIDVPEFRKAWLQYCRLYNAAAAEQEAALGRPMRGNSLRVGHSRLTAYAASLENDPALAERAWKEFAVVEWGPAPSIETVRLDGPQVLNPVDEARWVSTNDSAQWSLAAIQNLALAGKALGG